VQKHRISGQMGTKNALRNAQAVTGRKQTLGFLTGEYHANGLINEKRALLQPVQGLGGRLAPHCKIGELGVELHCPLQMRCKTLEELDMLGIELILPVRGDDGLLSLLDEDDRGEH
jgi:hypothetical protein